MQLSLVTVSFDPETAGFPVDPLAGIPGEVVSVVEHFFEHGGLPRLLLVVHLRPPRDEVRGRNRGSSAEPETRAGPRSELSADEQAVYDRLRAWRTVGPRRTGCHPM